MFEFIKRHRLQLLQAQMKRLENEGCLTTSCEKCPFLKKAGY